MTRPEENPFRAAGRLHGGEHRPTTAELEDLTRQAEARHPEFTAEERRLSRVIGRRRTFLLGSGDTYPDGKPPYAQWVYASNGAVWHVTLTRVRGAFDVTSGVWVTR